MAQPMIRRALTSIVAQDPQSLRPDTDLGLRSADQLWPGAGFEGAALRCIFNAKSVPAGVELVSPQTSGHRKLASVGSHVASRQFASDGLASYCLMAQHR